MAKFHAGFVILLCAAFLAACNEPNDEAEPLAVKINEVGYHPDYPKLAFITQDVEPDGLFFLMDAENNEPIYEGFIQKNEDQDIISGDRVHQIDFSSVRVPGIYYILIPGAEYQSGTFRIDYSVYNYAASTAMQSFYYQRCGTEVNNGSVWTHPECHLDDAPFYDGPDSPIEAAGGWHDAGDYGKFAVTTVVSAAFQLYLFEQKPGFFNDWLLNIPEKTSANPDLLEEIKWGLDWLLKLQNREGGFYFKISSKKWTGEYLPHLDPDTRYVFGLSSTATAGAAAVSALAAQIYDHYDPEFANRLKKAAEHAWGFLEKNPGILPEGGFTNPPGVTGGEYADSSDLDERLWAAVELYRLTGSEAYHEWFLTNYQHAAAPLESPISWKNVSGFAWYSYLRMSETMQNRQARNYILAHLKSNADALAERVAGNGYRIALEPDEFYWGSNSVALGYGYELVQAYTFIGNKTYKKAALDQLHYVLGRNPNGISYVTGVGSNTVNHPYHQFSMELNHAYPVPGMVVGGPNNFVHLNDTKLSEYPAKTYEDNEKNYMVNETAINYTAPFIYLAGYFSDFTHARPFNLTDLESQTMMRDTDEIPDLIMFNN